MKSQWRWMGVAAATALMLGVSAGALQAQEYWPGARYDPAVPTLEGVLGHGAGERIFSHAELLRYLEALAEFAPERLQVVEYARSWEDRALVYAVIGAPENIARLDAIRAGMQRLGRPRTTDAREARALIADLPAVAWLSYGVHGNEISSPNAALLTAYHLLAARDDATVDQILSDAVVVIDPTQNPDGRDRFVHHYRATAGIVPADNPAAAEHSEPWPGGRTNHYYFDLNRDWFALTQPETIGRVANLQQFYPVVHVDLHEMGADSTYYFAPAADPYNPYLTEQQRADLELFGRGNARWFDRFGFDYFTREQYDAFYPGYGDSWPMFLGAAGMTYEQASARGLVVRRADGTDLSFREGVQHHFVASIATAQTAALNRVELLEHLYALRKSGIEDALGDVHEYVVPLRGDTSSVRKLVGVLGAQGIEVRRSTTALLACGRSYPAGSFSISLAQPSRRLVQTLLGREHAFEAAFAAEQERRRAKRMPAQIYDVTAWSLPLLYNVEVVPCGSPVEGTFEPAGDPRLAPGTVRGAAAPVAYLVPWGSAAAGRFLAAALGENLVVRSTDRAFVQEGTSYPRGTLIATTADNPPGARGVIERLARETGADVHLTDSSWVEDGVNFGSSAVRRVRRANIALAWDRPTSPGSAGATRFVLERQFGYPVTPIRTRQLGAADLSRFHVLVLPSGTGYGEVLGRAGVERLAAWVEAGGTLIGLDAAVSFLADPDTALLDVRRENRPGASDAPSSGTASSEATLAGDRVTGTRLGSEADYLEAIQPADELPDDVAGVLVRASIDPDHWITAGLPEVVHVMVNGRAVYTPITIDKGVNALRFQAADTLLASGYLWEESRAQLAYKPFTIVQPRERGFVIGFTADPNFRAFMDGLNVLFLNAVFGGATHARPLSATVAASW